MSEEITFEISDKNFTYDLRILMENGGVSATVIIPNQYDPDYVVEEWAEIKPGRDFVEILKGLMHQAGMRSEIEHGKEGIG